MAKPLRLVAWITRGVLSHHAELAAFATKYDLDIILFSETFLTPAVSFQLLVYTTYLTYCPEQNNPSCPTGGTAILVHKRIVQCQLPPPTTRHLEAMATALCIGDREVYLISAYLPPGRGWPLLHGEWDALLDHTLPTIAARHLQLQACLLYTSRCV